MSIASGLDDSAAGIDRVEAVLGVRGERPAERLKLGDNGLCRLVGLVLEHRDLAVAIQLDVSVVRRR